MNAEEYNLKEAELLKTVPAELRSWLSYLAYERGHSAGYSEVLSCLSDLVDGFPEAWKKFVAGLQVKVPEKHLNDAPVEYNNEEASAWSSGYDSCREAFLKALDEK